MISPLFEQILNESYNNIDKNLIRTYIRDLNNDEKLKSIKTTYELQEYLNSYFQPLGIEFLDGDKYSTEWNDNYTQGGQTSDDGQITVFVSFDDILETFDSKYDLQEALNSIGHTIIHELVHQYQFSNYRYRKPAYDEWDDDPYNKQHSYYSNKDELAAHAMQTVDELLDLGFTEEQIVNKVKTATKDAENGEGLIESHTAYKYWEEFGMYSEDGDKDRRVWIDFIRKVAEFAQ